MRGQNISMDYVIDGWTLARHFSGSLAMRSDSQSFPLSFSCWYQLTPSGCIAMVMPLLLEGPGPEL